VPPVRNRQQDNEATSHKSQCRHRSQPYSRGATG
jgi:hypothetical protein